MFRQVSCHPLFLLLSRQLPAGPPRAVAGLAGHMQGFSLPHDVISTGTGTGTWWVADRGSAASPGGQQSGRGAVHRVGGGAPVDRLVGGGGSR